MVKMSIIGNIAKKKEITEKPSFDKIKAVILRWQRKYLWLKLSFLSRIKYGINSSRDGVLKYLDSRLHGNDKLL